MGESSAATTTKEFYFLFRWQSELDQPTATDPKRQKLVAIATFDIYDFAGLSYRWKWIPVSGLPGPDLGRGCRMGLAEPAPGALKFEYKDAILANCAK